MAEGLIRIWGVPTAFPYLERSVILGAKDRPIFQKRPGKQCLVCPVAVESVLLNLRAIDLRRGHPQPPHDQNGREPKGRVRSGRLKSTHPSPHGVSRRTLARRTGDETRGSRRGGRYCSGFSWGPRLAAACLRLQQRRTGPTWRAARGRAFEVAQAKKGNRRRPDPWIGVPWLLKVTPISPE